MQWKWWCGIVLYLAVAHVATQQQLLQQTGDGFMMQGHQSSIASWGSGGATSYGYHIAVSSDCKRVMAGAVWHGQ